ncbi:MAG: single-stranded DNA-binding protein [Planctomycetota bacterium]
MAGSGFNRVILMGNLVRDPELRYTPSGTAVADLRLAVTSMRGRGNDRKEETVFVDVTVWDRMAETCNEYLSKGRPVLVEGRLRQDEWEDRETGKKRSKISVTANNIQFLGGGAGKKQGAPGPEEVSQANEEGLDSSFPANEEIPF